MKKLFALITTMALVLALCVVPIGFSVAEEPEGEGETYTIKEIVNIDFSKSEDEALFGTDYSGWQISEGAFHPKLPWANAYLKEAITGFGTKKTVITAGIYVAGGEMPALCFGVMDNVEVVGDNGDPSGITLRVYDGYETLYTSFAGGAGVNRIMDSQGGIYTESPVAHVLEMTFETDKTVTVKADGEVLANTTEGNAMENINYGELHDFTTGYIAMKATSSSTYISSIKVEQYEIVTDPPEEPPIFDLSQETGEVFNVDFSQPEDALRFGEGWMGWEVDGGKLYPATEWASAYLKQPFSAFGSKRVVITVEFLVKNSTNVPIFSIGVVDDIDAVTKDGHGPSGITLRFNELGYETLYTAFTGAPDANRIMDSQAGIVVSSNPVPHTLEMTFDLDKTVTVKIDGNVLSHTNGERMYKVNYAALHDFSTGYIALKATNTGTYISNIKVEQYDTAAEPETPPETPPTPESPEIDPSEDVSQEPDTNGNGNGTNTGTITAGGSGTVTIEVDGLSGCNSSISGLSALALVIATGITLIVIKIKHCKKIKKDKR